MKTTRNTGRTQPSDPRACAQCAHGHPTPQRATRRGAGAGAARLGASDGASDGTAAPGDFTARDAFRLACRLDVEVAKPGNVSTKRAGHGMSAQQFLDSAAAAAPALFRQGAPVGARILEAVIRTRQAANCNTNLGIVLLVAPLAAALETLPWPPGETAWRGALARVLDALSIDDARAAYRAIALAQPGGLGEVPEQSVHAEPSVDLRAAMTLAAGRDSIARQYANGFADIFDTGLAALRAHPGAPLDALTLALFLTFVSRWPDSHIVRKHGSQLAHSVTRDALMLRHALHCTDADGALPEGICDDPCIDEWDARLKADAVNPGTSADLTVATLFVAACLAPRPFAAAAQPGGNGKNWHGKC